MFDLLSIHANEAFDVAKTRLWGDKRWTWHSEYLIWGLLQSQDNAAIRALRAIGADVAGLTADFEKLLGPETKPEPAVSKFEKFGKEFGTYLHAVKKHYGYGKQDVISTLDLMEGFTRFAPRRVVVRLKKFAVSSTSLKRARKMLGHAAVETKGWTEQKKQSVRTTFEYLIRQGRDPKKFGFESWDKAREWLTNL